MRAAPGIFTVEWTIEDHLNTLDGLATTHVTNNKGFRLGFNYFRYAFDYVMLYAKPGDTLRINVTATFVEDDNDKPTNIDKPKS